MHVSAKCERRAMCRALRHGMADACMPARPWTSDPISNGDSGTEQQLHIIMRGLQAQQDMKSLI